MSVLFNFSHLLFGVINDVDRTETAVVTSLEFNELKHGMFELLVLQVHNYVQLLIHYK